jgi:hypothetical protein
MSCDNSIILWMNALEYYEMNVVGRRAVWFGLD